MQRILKFVVCACLLYFVTSVPVPAGRDVADKADDPAEKELSRHPHADNEIAAPAAGAAPSSNGPFAPDSPIESAEVIPDSSEEAEEEEELYDITLGDVIRDFLITLRNRPDIVKDLIESEKERLIARLAEVEVLDSQTGSDALENDLAEYMASPEQLRSLPKMVEKKAGRGVADSNESDRQGSISWPTEGGLGGQTFNYRQFISSSSSSEEDSESRDSNERKWMKYKSGETSESSETADTSDEDSSRRHSDSSESRDSSSDSSETESRDRSKGRPLGESKQGNEEELLKLLGKSQNDGRARGQPSMTRM